MDQLTQIIKRPLEGSRFFASGSPIVVATSTGLDSMVLLTLLQELVPADRLIVAHVNHHLRAQSAQEEAFIRHYCQERGLRLAVKSWTEHPATGVEAAARGMRYAFFAQVMADYQARILVTAHHQNDLAETVLMKLVRGGDLHQLVALQPRRTFAGGDLIRPLLPVPRVRLKEYALSHGVRWFEDATNADLTITRNRYRHQHLPALERENPRLLDELTDFHQQLTTTLAATDLLVGDRLATMVDAGRLDLTAWQKQPTVLQPLLLRTWLSQQGVTGIKQNQLTQLVASLRASTNPHQSFDLPGHRRIFRTYHWLSAENVDDLGVKPGVAGESVVKFAHWYKTWTGEQILVTPATEPAPTGAQQVATITVPTAALPLRLAPADPADRLRLKGGHHQSIRRALINAKVPQARRAAAQVLADQAGTIYGLVGVKFAWYDRPQSPSTSWQTLAVYQTKGENNG